MGQIDHIADIENKLNLVLIVLVLLGSILNGEFNLNALKRYWK